MIKSRIGAFTFLMFLTAFNAELIFAQQTFSNQPLRQIQQAYQTGEVTAETAALQQFRTIFKAEDSSQSATEFIKCATPAFAFLHQHREEVSDGALAEINRLKNTDVSQRRKLQEVYTSESGKFDINYEVTGFHAVPSDDANLNGVPDYVEWVGEAADSSYRHEVLTIGFKDPIPAGTRYQVVIENMAAGLYGYTQTFTELQPQTKIFIDNDFSGGSFVNTDPEGHQKGAVKVTMAHEFRHAIQFAQNEWEPPAGSIDWIEMDATLMEEVVYDDVNDYYNYIKINLESQIPTFDSVFGTPYSSVPGSYFYITWMLYYTELYGNNELWRKVWERIEEDHFLGIDEAMTDIMAEDGYSFDEAFVQNHLWHFASGARAPDGAYGFEEKNNYPTSNIQDAFDSVPEDKVEIQSIPKLAARYFEVTPDVNDEGFIGAAVNFDSTQIGLGLLLFLKNGDLRESITVGAGKSQVYIPFDINWEDVEQVGVVVANFSLNRTAGNLSLEFGKDGDRIEIRDPLYAFRPEETIVYQNFPNPFNQRTTIRFDLETPSQVRLEVYDILGRKIKTLINESRFFGRFDETFDASEFASGVYLYRLQIDDKVHIKKMTLVK